MRRFLCVEEIHTFYIDEGGKNKHRGRGWRTVQAVGEQEELLNADIEGREHTLTKTTYETTEDGARVEHKKRKRVAKWFWCDGKKWYLNLRYGVKIMELNKGRNALVVDERDKLIDVIDKLKGLVEDGGLDDVMERAALNK